VTPGEWLELGVREGWVSEPACATHDGVPTNDEEDGLLEEGFDPCLPVVRLW
jgi:hypothetical protein